MSTLLSPEHLPCLASLLYRDVHNDGDCLASQAKGDVDAHLGRVARQGA
jgi:hypothetical protein